MIIFKHRVNTLEGIKELQPGWGVEVDIRYHADELILTHDPYGHHKAAAPTLRNYLEALPRSTPLILNLKSEGIEQRCIELMEQYAGRTWFFLDMSMPILAKYAFYSQSEGRGKFGPQNLCVRFSEHEALEYALGFGSRADWVWIDCFRKLPLTQEIAERLRDKGFKLCLVSPELQGHQLEMITTFQEQLSGIRLDGVCTKRPDLWEKW